MVGLTATTYTAFVLSGLALNLVPGPDMLFVVGSAAGGGRRAGLVASLGIGLGGVVHTAAAAAGLSALLASSALAFGVLKYAGALYLIVQGARAMLARAPAASVAEVEARPPAAVVFRRAFVTSALNPKVAVFFLAFVPQFVDRSAGPVGAQFLALGLTFCATGTAVNAGVGAAAGAAGRLLRGRARGALERAAGALFVGLGLRLVFSRDR